MTSLTRAPSSAKKMLITVTAPVPRSPPPASLPSLEYSQPDPDPEEQSIATPEEEEEAQLQSSETAENQMEEKALTESEITEIETQQPDVDHEQTLIDPFDVQPLDDESSAEESDPAVDEEPSMQTEMVTETKESEANADRKEDIESQQEPVDLPQASTELAPAMTMHPSRTRQTITASSPSVQQIGSDKEDESIASPTKRVATSVTSLATRHRKKNCNVATLPYAEYIKKNYKGQFLIRAQRRFAVKQMYAKARLLIAYNYDAICQTLIKAASVTLGSRSASTLLQKDLSYAVSSIHHKMEKVLYYCKNESKATPKVKAAAKLRAATQMKAKFMPPAR